MNPVTRDVDGVRQIVPATDADLALAKQLIDIEPVRAEFYLPTILRLRGYRFYFFSREPNEPAHVHVDRGGASAKVWLRPVALVVNAGFASHELGEILRMVREYGPDLIRSWDEFFGNH